MNVQKKVDKVSQHFPIEIRAKLVRAAQTPVSSADPLARARAIDDVVAWSRTCFPRWFR